MPNATLASDASESNAATMPTSMDLSFKHVINADWFLRVRWPSEELRTPDRLRHNVDFSSNIRLIVKAATQDDTLPMKDKEERIGGCLPNPNSIIGRVKNELGRAKPVERTKRTPVLAGLSVPSDVTRSVVDLWLEVGLNPVG